MRPAKDHRRAGNSGARRWRVVTALALLISTGQLPAAAGSRTPAGPMAAEREPAAVSEFELPVPAPPLVLTPFDPPADPWGSGHRGVDLAARADTPVLAAADGVVAFAGMVAGRPVVSVKHTTALRTTYEPVTATVRAGQRVRVGQQIGVLITGHPSCSPAVCLHWGARIGDDQYVDPLRLLSGLRVRLKPWGG